MTDVEEYLRSYATRKGWCYAKADKDIVIPLLSETAKKVLDNILDQIASAYDRTCQRMLIRLNTYPEDDGIRVQIQYKPVPLLYFR